MGRAVDDPMSGLADVAEDGGRADDVGGCPGEPSGKGKLNGGADADDFLERGPEPE
jgi:hypothetical protein